MFATPEEAEQAFYEALEQADTARLMQIWADDEEIVCIHPGGLRAVGHTAVQESWQQTLAAGPLHIRPLRPLVMQRSEEHTSELQSLMRISYAVFCLNKKSQ